MNLLQKKLKRMGYSNYTEYLESPHWLKFKRKYYSKKRDCLVCNTTKALNLHHVSYDHLGDERQSDVIPLCRPCHVDVHDYLFKHYLGVDKTLRAVEYLKVERAKKSQTVNPEPQFYQQQIPEFEKDLVRSGLTVQFDTCLLFGVGTRNVIPNSVLFKIGQKIGQLLGEYKALPRKTKLITKGYREQVQALLEELERTYNISLKSEKLLAKIFSGK